GLSSQYRDVFRYAAVVHEPKAAGPGAGLQTTRRMLEYLSSAILCRPVGYEIRRESCISSLEAVKVILSSATSNIVLRPVTSRFGVVGSRHFDTHGPRAHKVLGLDLINFRESLRVKAKRSGSSRIGITQNDEEGFDCDCRARVLGRSGRCWRYRRGRNIVQEMYALP